MFRVTFCVFTLLLPAAARADVRLLAVCSDNMVLQRNSRTHISGEAAPGESVTVTFRGQKATGIADEKGKWSVPIEAGTAATALEMTVAGNNTIRLSKVRVRRLWIG